VLRFGTGLLFLCSVKTPNQSINTKKEKVMETNDLGDYLIRKNVRKEAMSKISRDYPLNEEMLKKYRDELDWAEVSDNSNIGWTVAMLERWKNKLDWKVLSNTSNATLLTTEVIEKFKDLWDWETLSGNPKLMLSFDLLDKFIDCWDWSNIIDRYVLNDKTPSWELFRRYRQYIPVENIERTWLWDFLVEEEVSAIKKELVLGE
jgi:hypothetical protein